MSTRTDPKSKTKRKKDLRYNKITDKDLGKNDQEKKKNTLDIDFNDLLGIDDHRWQVIYDEYKRIRRYTDEVIAYIKVTNDIQKSKEAFLLGIIAGNDGIEIEAKLLGIEVDDRKWQDTCDKIEELRPNATTADAILEFIKKISELNSEPKQMFYLGLGVNKYLLICLKNIMDIRLLYNNKEFGKKI